MDQLTEYKELEAVKQEIKDAEKCIMELEDKEHLTDTDKRKLSRLESQLARLEKKEAYWMELLKTAQQQRKQAAAMEVDVQEPQPEINSLLAALDALPAPSTYAQAKKLVEWEDKSENPIQCHRPDYSTMPISAKFGIFSQFLLDAENIEIGQSDVEFVHSMCISLARAFKNEDDRMAVVEPVISEWFLDTGIEFVKEQYSKSPCDGGLYKAGMPLVLFEGKNELGLGGCCPYVQAAAVYGTYIKHKSRRRNYDADAAYPCFIVYIAGPFLGIAGVLTHESKIICDPLTPMHALMYEPWNRYVSSSFALTPHNSM